MLRQHLERLQAHCDPVLLRTHCALDETLREGRSAVGGQGRVTEVRQPVTKHRFRQTAEHQGENVAARGEEWRRRRLRACFLKAATSR